MTRSVATVLQREVDPDQALRIFNGLTVDQWAAIEAHVDPVALAVARSQTTRAEAAAIIVREAARVGLVTIDFQDEKE